MSLSRTGIALAQQTLRRHRDQVHAALLELVVGEVGAVLDGRDVGLAVPEVSGVPLEPDAQDLQARAADPLVELERPRPDGLVEEVPALALEKVLGQDLAVVHPQEVEADRAEGPRPEDLERARVDDAESRDLVGLALPILLGPGDLAGEILVEGVVRPVLDQPFEGILDVLGRELTAVVEADARPELESDREPPSEIFQYSARAGMGL